MANNNSFRFVKSIIIMSDPIDPKMCFEIEDMENGDFMVSIGYNESDHQSQCVMVDGQTLFEFLEAHLTNRATDELPRCACGKPATINNKFCSDCAFDAAIRR